MCLGNDTASSHPVHTQIRAIGPRALHHKKGRGQLERLRVQDQKEIKRLKQELRHKEKALAEAAALLIASKEIQAFWGEDGDD